MTCMARPLDSGLSFVTPATDHGQVTAAPGLGDMRSRSIRTSVIASAIRAQFNSPFPAPTASAHSNPVLHLREGDGQLLLHLELANRTSPADTTRHRS